MAKLPTRVLRVGVGNGIQTSLDRFGRRMLARGGALSSGDGGQPHMGRRVSPLSAQSESRARIPNLWVPMNWDGMGFKSTQRLAW